MKPTEKFQLCWNEYGLAGGDPERELVFDTVRKWRFDYAWEGLKVAVEIDGFGFGHQAQQRLSDNHQKQNAAITQGWVVLRYTSRCIASRAKCEDAIEQVVQVLCDRGTGKI